MWCGSLWCAEWVRPMQRTQRTLPSVTEPPSSESTPDGPTEHLSATLTLLMPAGHRFLEAACSTLLPRRKGGEGRVNGFPGGAV